MRKQFLSPLYYGQRRQDHNVFSSAGLHIARENSLGRATEGDV